MLRKLYSTILIIITFASLVLGQEFSKTGTSAAQFLKIPVGARAASLGNSFAAIVNDATSLYWNPSGIASLGKIDFNFTHTQWIAGLNHNFFGAVIPIDDMSAAGFGVISLDYGSTEITTIDKPKGTGAFYEASDLSFWFSYARFLLEDVSVGISVKYISQKIWNVSASSIAIDLGALLYTGFYDLKLGLSFQNFGLDMQLDGSDLIRPYDPDIQNSSNLLVDSKLTTGSNSLPVYFSGSLAISLIGDNAPISSLNSSLIITANGIHLSDNPEHYSLGMEYGFMRTLYFRGGYIFNSDEANYSFGVGLNMNAGVTSFIFDYAYSDYGVFNPVHIFSVGLNL
ncbi:MAG: PorV/PorQ family protein [Melioribacteraceae bacterium]|nr:PorV/PorQ family protein [Melioribacteraceae bacterium]